MKFGGKTLVYFSKTSNSTRPSNLCYFEIFEKLTPPFFVFFFQIALEIMLLPILINDKAFIEVEVPSIVDKWNPT